MPPLGHAGPCTGVCSWESSEPPKLAERVRIPPNPAEQGGIGPPTDRAVDRAARPPADNRREAGSTPAGPTDGVVNKTWEARVDSSNGRTSV